MRIVMAPETSHKFKVAYVVGIDIPPDLHFRENVFLKSGLDSAYSFCNQFFFVRVIIGIIIFVEIIYIIRYFSQSGIGS